MELTKKDQDNLMVVISADKEKRDVSTILEDMAGKITKVQARKKNLVVLLKRLAKINYIPQEVFDNTKLPDDVIEQEEVAKVLDLLRSLTQGPSGNVARTLNG